MKQNAGAYFCTLQRQVNQEGHNRYGLRMLSDSQSTAHQGFQDKNLQRPGISSRLFGSTV